MNTKVSESLIGDIAPVQGDKKSILTDIVRWIIYGLVFLMPLFFLPFTSDILEFNKHALLTFCVGIGLVLYLVNAVHSGILEYRKSVFYIPLLLIVAGAAIASIFSMSPRVSIFGLGANHSNTFTSWIGFAILLFLLLNVARNKGREILDIMMYSVVLSLVITGFQVIGLSPFTGTNFSNPSFNTIGTVNSAGMIAALFLPLLFGWFSIGGDKIGTLKRIARYAGIISALFLLVVVNWLPVWIIAFTGIAAYLIFGLLASPTKNRMRFLSVPLVVIVMGIVLLLIGFQWNFIKNNLPIEVSPTHKTSYQIARDVIKDNPLGYGLENFPLAYEKFKPRSIANTIFFQTRFYGATSEVANFIIEGGVLMALLFAVLLWFYLRSLIKQIERRFDGIRSRTPIWAASVSMFLLLFLYPANMTIMFIFVVLLALLTLNGTRGKNAVPKCTIDMESDNKYSFLGSMAFIIGLVIVIVGGYFAAIHYISNVQTAIAMKSQDKDEAIGHLLSAVALDKGDTRMNRLLSQVIISKLADDLKEGPSEGETKEEYTARINSHIDAAIRIAKDATDIEPADAQNWINRGFVYQNFIALNVENSGPFAVSIYEESLKRNPYNPLAYLRIGNTYLAMADSLSRKKGSSAKLDIIDNLDKAEENFSKAIELYNNYGQALYNLAVVYDRKGQLPQAIKQFEKLVVSSPRDPSIAFQLGLLYYRNNQKSDAVGAWEYAVRLFPDYSNARWYLSLAYEERGDLKKALEQVKQVERLNPDNELVKKRLEQLEAGIRKIPPEKVLDQSPLD